MQSSMPQSSIPSLHPGGVQSALLHFARECGKRSAFSAGACSPLAVQVRVLRSLTAARSSRDAHGDRDRRLAGGDVIRRLKRRGGFRVVRSSEGSSLAQVADKESYRSGTRRVFVSNERRHRGSRMMGSESGLIVRRTTEGLVDMSLEEDRGMAHADGILSQMTRCNGRKDYTPLRKAIVDMLGVASRVSERQTGIRQDSARHGIRTSSGVMTRRPAASATAIRRCRCFPPPSYLRLMILGQAPTPKS